MNPTQNPKGTATTIYRRQGPCPSDGDLAGFVPVAVKVTGGKYIDHGVTKGTIYCYVAASTNGPSQSAPSDTAQAEVPKGTK